MIEKKKFTLDDWIEKLSEKSLSSDFNNFDSDFEKSILEYYKLVNNMEDGICFIDTNAIVKIWNKSIEKVYDIKAKDILGRRLNEFFSDSINCKVLKTEEPILQKVHNPGRNMKIIITSIPVYHNEKLIGVLSYDKACSQQSQINKQLEEAQNKIKLLLQELDKYEGISDNFFVGHDPDIVKLMNFSSKIAYSDIPIVIYGESGTGKEVLSRYIHRKSKLKGEFVAVNCSAIPDNLFESEFFGYKEGAFTGAKKGGFKGFFEQADGGTLFLDEISELPLQQQTKLLRVLQEEKVRPLGALDDVKVNVRIICATNMDLNQKVDEKDFRLDLYYRLNGVKLYLPPLRERKDLKEVIKYFVKEAGKKYNNPNLKLSNESMEILCNYSWKGNIRELKNAIAQMAILAHDDEISTDVIPNEILIPEDNYKKRDVLKLVQWEGSLEDNLRDIERNIIAHILYSNDNNISKSAKVLQIPRSTLHYKIDKLKIKL